MMNLSFLQIRFLLFLACLLVSDVAARDWYVHPELGSDENSGTQGAPVATAQVAVDRAGKGDRIVLMPEGALYRQSITIDKGKAGLVIEGNGVTLTGSDPLDPADWESLGDDLHRVRLPATAWNRHLLIRDGRAHRMGRLCHNPTDFPPVEELEEGEFRWDPIGEDEGWLTYRGSLEGLEWSVRRNGIATSGEVGNIKVFNLIAKHFLNDGFNIHGNARGIQFFNIAGFENFDEGFSAHDTASCWIQNGKFFGNEHAVADVNQADTYYEDCEFGNSESVEVLFRGGRHSLTRCRIVAGKNSVPIDIQSSPSENPEAKSIAASLVLREITVDADHTTKQTWRVGPGVTVFIDTASFDELSPLDLDKSPASRISRDLYRVFPIGRNADGTPIMTWVGGGTGGPRSSSYRIIHLDRHSSDEVAEKISPENDWFGLMAPLPTGDFPPTGDAFLPENEAAHAIWRWIGLTAPNAVFVPDTPNGQALAAALQENPPAGVGMVDIFVSSSDDSGTIRTAVLPTDNGNQSGAKSEMSQRLSRTPDEVFTALTPHYGTGFSGSYIDALALIAKLRMGSPIDARSMAEARATDPLPKNGGTISGTLLYGEFDESWATDRIQTVASLAFDESGNPLEAMPFHNEMSDAVFMAGPILALAGARTGDDRYFDMCIRQVKFIQDLCLRDDGLYRHSPLNEAAWGRGNGFPALGIAMILDHFPSGHPDRDFLIESLQAHLEALADHQSAEGMWHQLIDLPDSYAEFTCTCMISYAMLRGIDQGWLDSPTWSPRVHLAWEAIKSRIASDGKTLINVCTSTGKQKTLEDYYRRKAILGSDARGGAMALLLAGEISEWFDASEPR